MASTSAVLGVVQAVWLGASPASANRPTSTMMEPLMEISLQMKIAQAASRGPRRITELRNTESAVSLPDETPRHPLPFFHVFPHTPRGNRFGQQAREDGQRIGARPKSGGGVPHGDPADRDQRLLHQCPAPPQFFHPHHRIGIPLRYGAEDWAERHIVDRLCPRGTQLRRVVAGKSDDRFRTNEFAGFARRKVILPDV